MAIPDKTSQRDAQAVLIRLIPDASERANICHELALFWSYAKRKYPDKTFITLASRYVRLNVGMVEVLVIYPDYILAVVDEKLADPSFEGPYKSLPDACPCRLERADYIANASTLRPSVFSLIDKLGYTRTNPSTPKGHSPGLATLLESQYSHIGSEDRLEEPASEFCEGDSTTAMVSRYERDPKARAVCLQHYNSYSCQICGFDFLTIYGQIGKDFIHVHHLYPLSTLGKRSVNPKKDMIPVCPNCHAMLHTRSPVPLAPEELRKVIRKQLSGRRKS